MSSPNNALSKNAVFKNAALTAIFLAGSLASATAQTALPDAIAAPGEAAILTLHAEGAQVYECKTGTDGALAWTFREPIATLFSDGKTVGRHYAGPTWEYSDGSAVVGQVAGTSPGSGRHGYPLVEAQCNVPARQRRSHRQRRCSGSTPWAEG